ncbi:hypothetical protein MSHOH_1754 [Methanosarcina horonobensis HB-1 = JCM 15518]|uniref:Uncharacterized protein n=1 Tax=Methanosarcina horonobensis HB-1 = JCM 15518 TaxID=1434110 RepID=A0A0E3SDP7_9EURY|nr:hypothetical protein MSHOH_1754 [Methanosarcina horonobensis HB-1 = JCM 15518]
MQIALTIPKNNQPQEYMQLSVKCRQKKGSVKKEHAFDSHTFRGFIRDGKCLYINHLKKLIDVVSIF